MNKKRFFLCLLILVSGFLLNLNYFGAIILEKYINSLSIEYFKSNLHHQGIDLSYRELKIKKPHFFIEGEEVEFKAESVTIHYRIHFFSLSVDMEISVEKPHLELPKESSFPSLLQNFLNQKTWLKVNPYLKIQQGILVLKTEKVQKLEIEAEFDLKHYRFGKISLNHDEFLSNPSFKAEFSYTPEKDLSIGLSLNDANLKFISEALNAIYPLYEDWSISEGVGNGTLAVHRLHDKKLKTFGNLLIKDCLFKNSQRAILGKIDFLNVDLSSDVIDKSKEIGRITFLGENSLKFIQSQFSLEGIKGNINIEKHGNAGVLLQAKVNNEGKFSDLNFDGKLHFLDLESPFISMSLDIFHSDEIHSTITFESKDFSPLSNSLGIQFKNIGYQDLHLFRKILSTNYNFILFPEVRGGILNARAIVNFKGFMPYSIDFKEIEANNLIFDFLDWNFHGEVKKTQGAVSVDLNKNEILKTLKGNLNIIGGSFQFKSSEEDIWEFSQIETEIAFKEGLIQKSLVKGDFASLLGTIEMDWFSKDEILKFHFNGSGKKICDYLNFYHKKIPKEFYEDHINFKGGLSSKNSGLHVNANLEILKSEDLHDHIIFEFDIEKLNGLPFASYLFMDETIKETGTRVMDFLVSSLADPTNVSDEKRDKKKSFFSGYILKNGMLKAENLSLERYVTPFLFQEGSNEFWRLEGFGNFYTTFDQEKVAINYTARDVVVDNENFCIKIPKIDHTTYHRLNLERAPSHSIHLNNLDYYGMFPIEHGIYYDKNYDLSFNEISALLKFTKNRIEVTNVETYCSGLFFTGNINININPITKNSLNVEIFSDSMNGKVSQLQSLFGKFNKSPLFLDFPIEGDIHFRKDGGYIFLNISPEKTEVTSKFQAVLLDGSISFAPLDLSLRELEFYIDYDQLTNKLLVNEIQGTLLVGEPGSVEEFVFSGDKILFTDFTNSISEFDFWIGDRHRDIIRLAGKTKGLKKNEGNDESVLFDIDKSLSHFGDVYPTTFNLKLKNWQIIEEFELDLKLHLATLFKDLKKACHSGISLLSKEIYRKINKMEHVNGDFKILLKYIQDEKSLFYDIIGSDLEFASSSYKNILLNGCIKENKTCAINQFRLDDLSIAAEAVVLENDLKVNFLGLKYGNSFLLGLDGDYFYKLNKFEGKINLIEVSLDNLSEFPQLCDFMEKNQLKGNLKGIGKLLIEKKASSELDYNAIFTMTGTDVSYRDISFGEIDAFSCQVKANNEISFRNISTVILSPDQKNKDLRLDVEKIHYSTLKDEMNIEELKLHVPSDCLGWFSAKLRYAFYEQISPTLEDQISKIKDKDSLEVFLNLNLCRENYLITMRLPEGVYNYFDEPLPLSDFLLTMEPSNLILSTGYRYQQKKLWMTLHSRDPQFLKGTLLLYDKHPSIGVLESQSLLVNWETDLEKGFYIKSANGKLGGISVNLAMDQEDFFDDNYFYLNGDFNINLPDALLFTSSDFMLACQKNNIFGSLKGKGKFSISKTKNLSSIFAGNIAGQNIGLKGYYFNSLSTQVKYTSNYINLFNCSLDDTAGFISAQDIFLKNVFDSWVMEIPAIHIWNFRPWRLKEVQPLLPQKPNVLVFNHIYIEKLNGKLSETETWKGEGLFKFSNPPKTNLQHTILAFPHEVITKIGLNPSVLTPVIGTVFYEIKDGKIVLKKFKDIYSESKGSKFYLPQSASPSYIDFDGNMHIQVRMKQYNLLFKIAELMTVTLKGTLDKPIYSIRQEKMRRSSRSRKKDF